jgi:tetratricopeptide (TPR) repeat protein
MGGGMGGGAGGGMGGMGGGMGGSQGVNLWRADAASLPNVEPEPQVHAEPAKAADDPRPRLTKIGTDWRITLQPWDGASPYLNDFEPGGKADWYAVYLKNAQSHGASPSFFADCSDFFRRNDEPALALRVLSNLAEIRLDDATLLRTMAYRLARMDELDLAIETLEQALQLRPEEPQSYRDLALMLSERADNRMAASKKAKDRDEARRSAYADYARAIDLLVHVVRHRWDARFPEIEVIALEEANRILSKAKAVGYSKTPLDRQLIKRLDADLRIVMTWDGDNTNVNLKVTEPSGESASVNHRQTAIGGMLSRDFSAGYGPERYMVRKAMKGTYKIEACDYRVEPSTLLTPVIVQVDVFTNYGRADEQHQSFTARLQQADDHVTVGRVQFTPQ